MNDINTRLAKLEADLKLLQSENDIRRVVGRYMFLCDVPVPEFGMSESERAESVADLFTQDGVWEGVGGTHGQQFGKKIGQGEIGAHFLNFYTQSRPKQVFNTHYLCSEQIVVHSSERAEGRWVQFQPWIYENGDSLLRSSRLRITFRQTDAGWKISHYRTENLFVSCPLPSNWASKLIDKSVLTAESNANTASSA